MEARESLRGAGPSKMLIAVIAIGTTLALGVIGGVVVKNISGATTTSNPSHIVQAQSGRAMVYPKHSGLQTLDDTAAPAVVAGQSAKAAGGADDTFAPALVGGRSATGRGDNAGDGATQLVGARSATGHGDNAGDGATQLAGARSATGHGAQP